MKGLRWWVGCVVLAGVLAGCGGESPPPAPEHRPQAPAKPSKAKTQPVSPTTPSSQPEFVYQPQGLRDPFQPFIRLRPEKKTPKVAPAKFVPKTPLQRYSLEDLRLVGIVWQGETGNSRALVEDPDGKGYIVRVGTLIGDRGGKIVSIRPDGVEVEERVIDILGEVQINRVTMRLHTPEGEVRP